MEEKEKKDYPDERYPVWGPAEPAPAEPLTWAISYDGKTPYALWDDGDGALLDLEIKRLGGTWSKMALYAAPEARKPYPSYAAEEATRSKQVAHAAPAELACDIQPRPLAYSLADYHRAISDGPLHYTWKDKPHRLVYDLIAAVRYYAAPAAPAPDRVPMPQNDDQAAAMVSLGMAWLEQHAPERLAKPATLPPPFDEVGDPPRFVYTAEQMRDYALAAVAQAKPAPAPEQLTDEQIEGGRSKLFSVGNPFCPITEKAMRTAVRWAERCHGIGAASKGEQA